MSRQLLEDLIRTLEANDAEREFRMRGSWHEINKFVSGLDEKEQAALPVPESVSARLMSWLMTPPDRMPVRWDQLQGDQDYIRSQREQTMIECQGLWKSWLNKSILYELRTVFEDAGYSYAGDWLGAADAWFQGVCENYSESIKKQSEDASCLDVIWEYGALIDSLLIEQAEQNEAGFDGGSRIEIKIDAGPPLLTRRVPGVGGMTVIVDQEITAGVPTLHAPGLKPAGVERRLSRAIYPAVRLDEKERRDKPPESGVDRQVFHFAMVVSRCIAFSLPATPFVLPKARLEIDFETCALESTRGTRQLVHAHA